MSHRIDRREFLAGVTAAAIMPRMTQPKVRFSVIGVNHDHIFGMRKGPAPSSRLNCWIKRCKASFRSYDIVAAKRTIMSPETDVAAH